MWLIVSLYTEQRKILYYHYSYLNGSCHHQHPFLPSTRLHSNHSPVQKLWHQKWIPCSAIGVFRIYCWTNRANKVLIPHFWSKDPESPISGLHRHSLDYLLLSSQHVFTNFFNTNLKMKLQNEFNPLVGRTWQLRQSGRDWKLSFPFPFLPISSPEIFIE